MNQRLVKKVIRWLLAFTAVLVTVTGLGITEFRVVTGLTFGLLDKTWAFKLHTNTWIPFLVLLCVHILYSPVSRLLSMRNKKPGVSCD